MSTTQKQINIQTIVQDYGSTFVTELESELTKLKNKFNPINQILWDSISYSVLNAGKRLRPILSLLTVEAVQNSAEQTPLSNNPGLATGLAIELVHCGSLIHDDLPCMDDDDLRRGKPSNHKAFDEATALLAGDFLLAYPAQLLAETLVRYPAISPAQKTQALHLLQQAINDMILGQVMDMNLDTQNAGAAELKEMEKLKTGALLRASIEIAALLSNASEVQMQALNTYATNLGLAFQITDDILDATASTEDLGKTAGKDSAQAKLTFVREYGLAKSQQIAEDLIQEAKTAIGTSAAGLYTDKLNLVADYVISRKH